MNTILKRAWKQSTKVWALTGGILVGLMALTWFLIRVIPKPSRASYPCQQAAFPLASAFVIWLIGVVSSYFGLKYLGRIIIRQRWWIFGTTFACSLFIAFWSLTFPGSFASSRAAVPAEYVAATGFDWKPGPSNQPIGVARGIFPGRVVMTRNPEATKWAGRWNLNEDQWWLDKNTDVDAVSKMLSTTIQELTGAKTDQDAWNKIFVFYNQTARGLSNRTHKEGEVVAIKINLNNSSETKTDNQIDASPQMVLAMVRHLVYQAGVPQKDILIYDARRPMFPYMLLTVWKEFKDVRFMQENAPSSKQPVNPAYGNYTGLEGADWVEGVTYSAMNFDRAKLIPKQIMDATYIINLALLKLHSYPYNYMEDGDEGQTAVTMTGKNHAGSIKGTSELHAILNTKKLGTKNAYSPLVDLAASPNLGGKTILYVLDGLYCGRKWRSYPAHFPNHPFNNKTEPYENPEWPACVLASLDEVAIQSVGLDIMYAQSQNNFEKSYFNVPRILLRDHADDFLREMADPEHAPSGTRYIQGGLPVKSLGVFEHWNNDQSMQYSRNLNPESDKGIEFLYLPLSGQNNMQNEPIASTKRLSPEVIPGNGLAHFDFFYAGEAKTQNMYLVRNGKIEWSYTHQVPRGEISDAVILSNGNILFAHQFGVTEITPEKEIVWNHDAPEGTEIHTAQPIGNNLVLFLQNGNPAKLIVMNKKTGSTVRELVLPTGNPRQIHGHFRHARLTKNGTILVAHLDMGRFCEYDATGQVLKSLDVPGIWSAEELSNGNILVTSKTIVFEMNNKMERVWEYSLAQAQSEGYQMNAPQTAVRLSNGNTIVNTWFNQWEGTGQVDPNNQPVQAIEVTPDKKIVWALREWTEPTNLGPSTIIIPLSEPRTTERVHFGDIR